MLCLQVNRFILLGILAWIWNCSSLNCPACWLALHVGYSKLNAQIVPFLWNWFHPTYLFQFCCPNDKRSSNCILHLFDTWVHVVLIKKEWRQILTRMRKVAHQLKCSSRSHGCSWGCKASGKSRKGSFILETGSETHHHDGCWSAAAAATLEAQPICKGRKEALGPLGPWGSFCRTFKGPLRILVKEKLYLHVLLGAVGLIASATVTKQMHKSNDDTGCW